MGTFAIQVAKALGADVTAVCSSPNVDQARSLGADEVVDYTRADFTQTTARFDVILDLAGSRSPVGLPPHPRTGRRLRVLGWTTRLGSDGGVRVSFRSYQVVILAAHQTQQDLALLKSLIESGKVKPVIEKHYSLGEVSTALRYQGQGHAHGKTVITVAA